MLTTLLLLLAHKGEVSITPDVTFATVAGMDLKCDVYRPPVDVKPLGRAVAVYYGGAWVAGNKRDVSLFCREFAAKGFVAVAFQYSLAPKFKYPAMIDDARTGVRWIRSQAKDLGVDPKKVGACGFSAGAHLSLLLGSTEVQGAEPFPTLSSKVQAVASFAGPSDFNETDYPANLDPIFNMVLGKPRKEAADLMKAASPSTYFGPKSAPTYIYQGLADKTVVPNQGKIVENALRKAKVPVETSYLEGVGHTISGDEKGLTCIGQATEFLKKHLR